MTNVLYRQTLAAILLGLLGMIAGTPSPKAANLDHGAQVYKRCAACHSLERHRSGPKHCGLIGRRAGSIADYKYSEAMRMSGIVWTPETLDAFLENPMKTVPGTRMGYGGVRSARDRADLIAFLARAADDPETCPQQ